jgi:L-iditol 2-dehydrogenase
MESAVLTESLEFEIEERDRPSPASDEVLVATRDVGICGSDIHYWNHGRIGDYVVENALVLGHESAGEVVEVGDDVDTVEPGDRVALEPGVPCRRCEHCKCGEYHLCPHVTFMATPPDDGAFSEYVAWPADFAYVLPEEVSTREGALCEPLSVGLHASRLANVGYGDTVVITGAGPIGLLAMEAVKAAGASDVILTDVVESKLDRAADHGADKTVNVAKQNLVEEVEEYTDGRGVDAVLEASGAESAIKNALEIVRRGGEIVLIGLADEATIPLDILEIIDNELHVHGSFRYANTYDAAVDLLADGEVDVEWIIDFEEPMENVAEAFERVHGGEDVVKGMISFE